MDTFQATECIRGACVVRRASTIGAVDVHRATGGGANIVRAPSVRGARAARANVADRGAVSTVAADKIPSHLATDGRTRAVNHQAGREHGRWGGTRELVLFLRRHERPLLTKQAAPTEVDAAAIIRGGRRLKVQGARAHATNGRALGVCRYDFEGVDSDAANGALVVDDDACKGGRFEEEAAQDDRPWRGEVRVENRPP